MVIHVFLSAVKLTRMKRFMHIAFLFICSTISATNYFVRNGGFDQANGLSDASAWSTVNKVNQFMSNFKPGDSILFRCGDSWTESTIIIGISGTSGKNIVIGSYGSGNKPVIEAIENMAPIIVTAANRGFWTIDNLDLRASGKFGGKFNTVAIHHGYWKKDLGPVPGWIIQNCAFNSCLFLSGPNTIVRNNTFNGAGNIDNDGGAICFRGPECDSCIAEYNTITDYYDRGIWIYNGGSYPVFRNNVISNIHKGNDHGGSGINIDGYGVRVTYGEVYNNTISNADMSAITFENGFRASVYNNRIENCTGVMIWQYHAYAETGDIGIHHNIFHNGNNGVVILNAKGIKIVNNTFVKDDSQGTERIALYIVSDSEYVSEISFVNNIVAGTWKHFIRVPDLKDIWSAFDYNIMFASDGWIMNNAGRNLRLSQVQSLGYMLNGMASDPLFINNLSDWHLQQVSPAIDKGMDIGYNFDFEGNVIDTFPDIGALEFKGERTIPVTNVISEPKYLGAHVSDSQPDVIKMHYSLPLDDIIPPFSAFSVLLNSEEVSISALRIQSTEVSIVISESVSYGDRLTIAYTRPAIHPLQTAAGSLAKSFLADLVSNEVRTTKFRVYPNPAGEHITISSPENPNKSISVKITDMNGRILREYTFESFMEKTIHTQLSPGSYIILISSGSSLLHSEILLVQ